MTADRMTGALPRVVRAWWRRSWVAARLPLPRSNAPTPPAVYDDFRSSSANPGPSAAVGSSTTPVRLEQTGAPSLAALEALRAAAASLSEHLRHGHEPALRDPRAVADLAAVCAEALLDLYEGLNGLDTASAPEPSSGGVALSAAIGAVGRAAVAMATVRTVLADESTTGQTPSP
ncbi:hypothetical protein [Longispora urticae]